MAVCPVCNGKISTWKLCTLTNFSSISCAKCNTVLVANQGTTSLIGGLGAGTGGPLLWYYAEHGSVYSFFVALITWLCALVVVVNYWTRLEVKK
jgi:hypothetical protein